LNYTRALKRLYGMVFCWRQGGAVCEMRAGKFLK